MCAGKKEGRRASEWEEEEQPERGGEAADSAGERWGAGLTRSTWEMHLVGKVIGREC